jgi:hypothetical protein
MKDRRPKHTLRAKHKADQSRLDKAVDVILKGVPPEQTREQIIITSEESAPRALLGDDARALEPSGEVYDAMQEIVGLALRSDWNRRHFDRCSYYYVK